MKTLGKVMMIGVAGVLIWSCQTNDTKTVVNPASVSITAVATQSTLVLDSTNAKTTTATVISWNAAKYGAQLSVIYTIQYDTGSGTFAKPTAVVLGNNVLSSSYTVRQLNDLALGLGMAPGVAGKIKVRIMSDVGSPDVPVIYTPVITLNVTPYSEILPPKFPVPANLYLVGDATPGGWNNPVPTPSQQFTQIDPNTFGMIITLTAGGQYLLLPKNGDWSHKYNPVNSGGNPLSDTFFPDAGNNNIPGPTTTGLYKIIIDFVKGTYSLTLLQSNPVPPVLFIIGDATDQGWNNGPGLAANQQFTQISNAEFTLIANITVGLNSSGSPNSYLFLPEDQGLWTHKFGGASATGGTLLVDGAVPGSNTPTQSTSGSYLFDVNFLTMQYTVTKQ
jgi:hypothetical protein